MYINELYGSYAYCPKGINSAARCSVNFSKLENNKKCKFKNVIATESPHDCQLLAIVGEQGLGVNQNICAQKERLLLEIDSRKVPAESCRPLPLLFRAI